MKEIELLKTIFKDSPDILEPLNEIDKEIERLNNLLKETSQTLSEQTTKVITLKSENERLNNIINELERYINEEYIYDELGMKIFDASKLQDKLQELKGSDK